MFGPGKYDTVLTEILGRAGATNGILIIFDGLQGPGFSAQLNLTVLERVPDILRSVASQIESESAEVLGENIEAIFRNTTTCWHCQQEFPDEDMTPRDVYFPGAEGEACPACAQKEILEINGETK